MEQPSTLLSQVNSALRLRYQLDDVRCFPDSNGFNCDMWDSSSASVEYIPVTLSLVLGTVTHENQDINKIPLQYLFPHSSSKQILILGDAGAGKTVFCKRIICNFYNNPRNEMWRDLLDLIILIHLPDLQFLLTNVRWSKPPSLIDVFESLLFSQFPNARALSESLYEIVSNPSGSPRPLFLLDGYESIRDGLSNPNYKVVRILLTQVNVILTLKETGFGPIERYSFTQIYHLPGFRELNSIHGIIRRRCSVDNPQYVLDILHFPTDDLNPKLLHALIDTWNALKVRTTTGIIKKSNFYRSIIHKLFYGTVNTQGAVDPSLKLLQELAYDLTATGYSERFWPLQLTILLRQFFDERASEAQIVGIKREMEVLVSRRLLGVPSGIVEKMKVINQAVVNLGEDDRRGLISECRPVRDPVTEEMLSFGLIPEFVTLSVRNGFWKMVNDVAEFLKEDNYSMSLDFIAFRLRGKMTVEKFVKTMIEKHLLRCVTFEYGMRTEAHHWRFTHTIFRYYLAAEFLRQKCTLLNDFSGWTPAPPEKVGAIVKELVFLDINSNDKSSLIGNIRVNRATDAAHAAFQDLIHSRVETSKVNYLPVTKLGPFLETCARGAVIKLAGVKILDFANNGITDDSLLEILELLRNYYGTVELPNRQLCTLSFSNNKITQIGFCSLLRTLREIRNVSIRNLLLDYNHIEIDDSEVEGNSEFLSTFEDVFEQIDILDLSCNFIKKKLKSLKHFQMASRILYSQEGLTSAPTHGELESVLPVCASTRCSPEINTSIGWIGVYEGNFPFSNSRNGGDLLTYFPSVVERLIRDFEAKSSYVGSTLRFLRGHAFLVIDWIPKEIDVQGNIFHQRQIWVGELSLNRRGENKIIFSRWSPRDLAFERLNETQLLRYGFFKNEFIEKISNRIKSSKYHETMHSYNFFNRNCITWIDKMLEVEVDGIPLKLESMKETKLAWSFLLACLVVVIAVLLNSF